MLKTKVYDAKYKEFAKIKSPICHSKKPKLLKHQLDCNTQSRNGGKKPANGANVFIHYAGFLEDGELFDASIESVAKTFGNTTKIERLKTDINHPISSWKRWHDSWFHRRTRAIVFW
jgi:hypothetical protein